MARNRKNKSVAIRFGPAIKALLFCSLFVAAGVGYVWQKSLIAELGQQMKARETELLRYRDQNKKAREQLAGLTSPEALNERMRILKLGLELPKSGQVWWMVEPAALPPDRPTPAVQQYAARP